LQGSVQATEVATNLLAPARLRQAKHEVVDSNSRLSEPRRPLWPQVFHNLLWQTPGSGTSLATHEPLKSVSHWKN